MPQIPQVPSTPSVPTAPTGASDAAGAAKQDIDTAKKDVQQVKGSKKAEGPPKEGSVGTALAHDMDQVNVAVANASAANNTAGMEAGRDLAIAISATQNVYEDDMGKEAGGKIPPPLKNALDQLSSAIAQLNTMSKASLQVASTDAEQISNSLQYRPQEPKLVKFTPRFLVPAKDTYVVKMHFNGSFEMAAKPEFFASLIVHDHTYKPVASSAGDIEFGVPISDLFPPGKAGKQLQFVPGTLKVPWQSSSLMGKKHTRKEDDFKLLLLALPSGPGTIKYMASGTRLEPGAQQHHTSPPYYQCSGKSCSKPDDINHMWTEPPDHNCTVVQGSSSFDVSNSAGDWKKEFLGDQGEGVSYSVTTERHNSGTSSVAFTISFTETCAREVPNTIGDEIALGWGETKVLKSPPATWKVSLDSFDGQHTDFTQTSATNPFLKVTATPDSITLTTPDPATLVWP